jgi:hypothetical protein
MVGVGLGVGGAVGVTSGVISAVAVAGGEVGGRLKVGIGLGLTLATADAIGLKAAIADGLGLTRGPWAGRLSRMKMTAPTRTMSTKPSPAASHCAVRAFTTSRQAVQGAAVKIAVRCERTGET